MRALSIVILLVAGCGDNRTENTGTACTTAAMCYPTVDAGAILGTVTCLTKFPGGYCTHTCTADTECCAVAGECRTGFKQVCSTFENQPAKYCFISCEAADIAAAPNEGVTNADDYCKKFAGSGLTCRATGGGDPRKFCG